MREKVFGTIEAAKLSVGEGEDVYKIENPHRATLYVIASAAYIALALACHEWGIKAEIVG